MNGFCLSSCSAVDLNPEWMKKRDLRYICFRFTLGGMDYFDDMGVGGHLAPRKKQRGRRRTIRRAVEQMEAHAEGVQRQGFAPDKLTEVSL